MFINKNKTFEILMHTTTKYVVYQLLIYFMQ